MASRFFPVQGHDLGPLGAYATYNEASLVGPAVGAVSEDAGKVYRKVQFDNGTGNVASAAGGVAHWKTRASYIVTSDQTDAEAAQNSVAGGFLGIQTDQYYCYIQIGGVQSCLTSTSTVDGDAQVGGATDLTFDLMTVDSATWVGLPVAIAYADDTAGVAPVYWLLGALL